VTEHTQIPLNWLIILSPVLLLLAVVSIQMLAEVLARRAGRPNGLGLAVSASFGLAGGVLALLATVWQWARLAKAGGESLGQLFTAIGAPKSMAAGAGPLWAAGALNVDYFALAVCLLVCFILLLSIIVYWPNLVRTKAYHPELMPLMMLSASGMMLLGMSRDLLVTFIAIEIVSLPLYVMCGADERRQASKESSLKYFLLGAFASGFFVYGMALVYGAAGHLNYSAISRLIENSADVNLILGAGLALVGVGLLFKLALVPFHAWVPDVYQGAPTPVTAFMATGVKLAVFAAALRLVLEAVVKLDPAYWRDALVLFAVLSMVVGNLFALHQMSAKRLLAYSAIAHSGYLAVGLAAGTLLAAKGLLLYLLAYSLAGIGAFALITYLSPKTQDDIYLDELHELYRRAPVSALALTVLLLSMGGLPLTAGFIGKLAVFTEAWRGGLHALVIIAVLNSVVSFYYYLRFVLAMYMLPKAPGAVELKLEKMSGGFALVAIVTVSLTLLFGLMPQLLLDLLAQVKLGL
jgi:NADH-quinone oxidoreductase subunit N